REERLGVADAAPQQATRMFIEGDERPRLRFECLGDFNRSFRAPEDIRLEGFARDADGEFAIPVRVRHSPRQQGACLNIVGAVLRSPFRAAVPAPSIGISSMRILLATFIGPDFMTSPVVVVHPHEEVAEAAKLMSQRKIRRLPVVQEGKLVGMITENDIIRVWPQLIEVTREYARAGLESQFAKGIEGHCEACGVYSTNLVWGRNLLVCPECRGG